MVRPGEPWWLVWSSQQPAGWKGSWSLHYPGSLTTFPIANAAKEGAPREQHFGGQGHSHVSKRPQEPRGLDCGYLQSLPWLCPRPCLG